MSIAPFTATFSEGQQISPGGTAETALDRLLALRGRLGVTSGSLLFIATAGIAAGHETFTTDIDNGVGAFPATGDGYVVGPTIGGGIEVALNDKASLTMEGLVTKLGGLTATGDAGKGTSYNATASSTTLNVRSGINVHF